jgi:hypothetical protein
MMPGMNERTRPAPVFVGGTGRSGTSKTADLLNRHAAVRRIRGEVRFHVSPEGLLDLVAGRTTLRRFTRFMRAKWYRRPDTWREDREIGVHSWLDESTLEDALTRLQEDFAAEPEAAAGTFLRAVLDPAASDARMWVEHSPANAQRASELHRILPDLKMIHVVRDGRDTAVSMTRKPWGPDDPVEALRLWGHRMHRAHRALAALPPGSVHTFRWEDLVERDREPTYLELLGFLDLDDDPRGRAFLERLTPGEAHIGQWRTEVPEERRPEFVTTHAAVVEHLRRSGLAVEDADGAGPPADVEARILAQRLYETEAELAEIGKAAAVLSEAVVTETARAERLLGRFRAGTARDADETETRADT